MRNSTPLVTFRLDRLSSLSSISKTSLSLTLLTSALLSSLLIANSAHADTFKLRIGAGHPPVLPYTSQAKSFFVPEVTKRVKAKTGHTLVFTEAYGGSVAKLPEVLEATKSGLLDFGLLSTPFEPKNLFLQNYGYHVPFGQNDPVKAGKIARKLYEEIPELKTSLYAHNQEVLSVFACSNYNIITKQKISKPSDLKGVKLMAAGANAVWLGGTGAIPVQSGLPQAYNSLQTGVYEGVLMHFAGMKGFKLFEPAKFISVVNFGSIPINLMTVNRKTWQSLPSDVRTIIKEVALEYEQRVNQQTKEADKAAVDAMVAAGATVTEFSKSDIDAWVKALREVPKKAGEEGNSYGVPMQKLLSRYIQLLKEDGNNLVAGYQVK
jgi:TRAP-type C4-dicarboxylate transport system substrate-binding protein